jgi:type I restriction enzyme R subunit
VKHFDEHIRNNVDGKSKAMIVSKSRLHAVRYKLAIDKYFKENGYPFKALVAFSGKVIEEKDTIEYTEANMNGIPESQTKDQFKKDDYKFLIVAEKYQTGFDQPLLAAMYVDKKLGGVNAVQTLSRLNRTHPDKDEVFVLDFVNDTEDIKEAFQPYYTTTVLSEGTEPNILYNLQRDILSFKLFDEREITEFVEMWHRNVSPAELNAFLDAMLDRWYDIGDDNEESEEQIDFRDKITDYIKKYAFISQIITFTDTSLEAMYIFLRFYKKKLPLTRNPLPLELLELVNLETLKIPKTGETSIKLENKVGEMTPMSGSGRGKDEDDTEILSKILNEVNDRFGTTFSEEDRVLLNNLSKRLMDNEALVGAIHNNSSEDAIRVKFDEIFTKELISMFNSNFTTYQKIDKNADLKDYVSKKMFDFIQTQVKKGK